MAKQQTEIVDRLENIYGKTPSRWEYSIQDQQAEERGISEAGRTVAEISDEVEMWLVQLGRKVEDGDLGQVGADYLPLVAVTFLARPGHTFDYLVDTAKKWQRFGTLSQGQVRGVLNCLRAEALRKPELQPFGESFPRIVSALQKAKASADSKPMKPGATRRETYISILVPVGETVVKLSLLGSGSRTPGDVSVADYVSNAERHAAYVGGNYSNPGQGTYYGRIAAKTGEADGRLSEARPVIAALRELETNPEEKIREFSRTMGRCAICGAELTNGKSIERGIGPICAEKVGW